MCTVQHGWGRYASFTLTVHSNNSAHTVSRQATHKFFADESDWGFTSFAPLNRILDPANGFLVSPAHPPLLTSQAYHAAMLPAWIR